MRNRIWGILLDTTLIITYIYIYIYTLTQSSLNINDIFSSEKVLQGTHLTFWNVVGNIKYCCSVWLDGCQVAMAIFATSFNNLSKNQTRQKPRKDCKKKKSPLDWSLNGTAAAKQKPTQVHSLITTYTIFLILSTHAGLVATCFMDVTNCDSTVLCGFTHSGWTNEILPLQQHFLSV